MRTTALFAILAAGAYAQSTTVTTVTTTLNTCSKGCYQTPHIPGVITHLPYGSACSSGRPRVKPPPSGSAPVPPAQRSSTTTVVVPPPVTSTTSTSSSTTSGPARATGGAANMNVAGAAVLGLGSLFAALL